MNEVCMINVSGNKLLNIKLFYDFVHIHRLRNMFPDSKLFTVIHLELLDMGHTDRHRHTLNNVSYPGRNDTYVFQSYS